MDSLAHSITARTARAPPSWTSSLMTILPPVVYTGFPTVPINSWNRAESCGGKMMIDGRSRSCTPSATSAGVAGRIVGMGDSKVPKFELPHHAIPSPIQQEGDRPSHDPLSLKAATAIFHGRITHARVTEHVLEVVESTRQPVCVSPDMGHWTHAQDSSHGADVVGFQPQLPNPHVKQPEGYGVSIEATALLNLGAIALSEQRRIRVSTICKCRLHFLRRKCLTQVLHQRHMHHCLICAPPEDHGTRAVQIDAHVRPVNLLG